MEFRGGAVTLLAARINVQRILNLNVPSKAGNGVRTKLAVAGGVPPANMPIVQYIASPSARRKAGNGARTRLAQIIAAVPAIAHNLVQIIRRAVQPIPKLIARRKAASGAKILMVSAGIAAPGSMPAVRYITKPIASRKAGNGAKTVAVRRIVPVARAGAPIRPIPSVR